MKKYQVSFYVSGWFTTEVEVPDNITAGLLQENLNNGDFITSVVPGNPVCDLRPGFKEIGKVTAIDGCDAEYDEYRVSEVKE